MAMENRWKVRIKSSGETWEGPINAYWEVAHDPISDNYTPDDIAAVELLRQWTNTVGERYPDGLIPIFWFAASEEAAKFEGFPFALNHHAELNEDDFLTYYRWPDHAVTGEPLNWLTVPVIDKLWRKGRADKGGFIQEATGWKPAILQPYVYLPSLLSVLQATSP